jgi:hypothetical protein
LEGQWECRRPTRGKRAQIREFGVWPADGERLKPLSVRVTIQPNPPFGIVKRGGTMEKEKAATA